MTKRTPGPWRLDYTEIHGRRFGLNGVTPVDEDERVCIEGSGGARSYSRHVCTFVGAREDEANARLIAKAPDMVELLEAACEQLQNYLDTYGEINDADPVTHALLNAPDGIGAILSQIEGGES